MKKTGRTMAATTLSALALMASTPLAHAGDNYAVIQSSDVRLNESTPKGHFIFTLPSNFTTRHSAILQMRTTGVDVLRNDIYLNPPAPLSDPSSSGCKDVVRDGVNAGAWVGSLDKNSSVGDSTTYHQVISGRFLKQGTNVLVVCSRSSDGRVDSPDTSADNGVNIDDFSIGSIVLHFPTIP